LALLFVKGSDFMAAPAGAAVAKKILAQMAVDVAVDEQKRRRILILITSVVVGLMLLIAFIIYILTMPLAFLFAWMLPAEIRALRNFQAEHGFNQSVSTDDQDYIDGIGVDNGMIIYSDGTPIIYYNQFDVRWAGELYGTDRIATHGSAPTILSIVISSLTDNVIEPAEMAAWAVANGGWVEEQGSQHSLIPNAAEAFGLNVESDVQNNPQRILEALTEGKLVITLMGKGQFTSSSSFIVLRGIAENGEILIADPASRSRSEQTWEFDLIMNEAHKFASAGGAFWLIGE
jgi:hypothetical protein